MFASVHRPVSQNLDESENPKKGLDFEVNNTSNIAAKGLGRGVFSCVSDFTLTQIVAVWKLYTVPVDNSAYIGQEAIVQSQAIVPYFTSPSRPYLTLRPRTTDIVQLHSFLSHPQHWWENWGRGGGPRGVLAPSFGICCETGPE